MNREDILKNDFIFLNYEKFRDSEYCNRFLLMVEQKYHHFFKDICEKKKNESFILRNNILYVSNNENSYAFQLDDDFSNFVKEMLELNASVFNISFVFPECNDIFDFSFIGEI